MLAWFGQRLWPDIDEQEVLTSALRGSNAEAGAVARDAAPLATALGVTVGTVATGCNAALGQDASVDTLGGHGVGESHSSEAEDQGQEELHGGGQN